MAKKRIESTFQMNMLDKSKKSGAPKAKGRTRRFVFSLEGAHGVGKTTIYDKMQLAFEENNLLAFFPELNKTPPFPFGSKDLNIAFRSEVYYMQQMGERDLHVKQHLDANAECIVILDRSPISVLVYSSALGLSRKDFDLLLDMYENSFHWQSETIIYLYAKPETIMKRILHRGSLMPERLTWNEDDMAYLKKILDNYEYYLKRQETKHKASVIRVNTDNKGIDDMYHEILNIIEVRTGLPLYKKFTMPVSQLTLETLLQGMKKKTTMM
jgi:thymidylate kinase